MILELMSRDLCFAETPTALVHVTDTAEKGMRSGLTLCGRPVAGLVVHVTSRQCVAEGMCRRCLQSLRSEARWACVGVGGRAGRWRVVSREVSR